MIISMFRWLLLLLLALPSSLEMCVHSTLKCLFDTQNNCTINYINCIPSIPFAYKLVSVCDSIYKAMPAIAFGICDAAAATITRLFP